MHILYIRNTSICIHISKKCKMHVYNTYATVAKPASITSGELPFRSSTLTSAGMKGLKASSLASLREMLTIALRPQ